MEIADTGFSIVVLLGLAVIFASFEFMTKISIYILLILIDLCIDYKRWMRGKKGFGSKGDRGSYPEVSEMHGKIPVHVKKLLLIS